MARNKQAGNHPSYSKRKMSKAQIAKKKAYDKKYNATDKSKKYRAELNRERHKRKIYGKGGGDLAHSKDGKKLTLQSSSKNRANNRPKVRQTKAPS